MLKHRIRSSLRLTLGGALLAIALGAVPAAARPAITKPQFIAQADGLCARAIAQLHTAGAGGSLSTLATRGPRLIAIDTSTLAALRRVPQPSADAARISAMLSGAAATIGELRAIISAVRSGNRSDVRTHGLRYAALARRWHSAAAGYGLTSCAHW